jgi:hypothetical protein
MRATKLAQALTIFSSYAPTVCVGYLDGAYRLYDCPEDGFYSMTMTARNKLFSLGWRSSPQGKWYLPD